MSNHSPGWENYVNLCIKLLVGQQYCPCVPNGISGKLLIRILHLSSLNSITVHQYFWNSLRGQILNFHSKTHTEFFWHDFVVDLLIILFILFLYWHETFIKWWVTSLTFSCNNSWYNFEFVVSSIIAICPGPEAIKQLQTLMLPPPWFADGRRQFQVLPNISLLLY